jgi:hypothetical protein
MNVPLRTRQTSAPQEEVESGLDDGHQGRVAARRGRVDAGHALGREARDIVGTADRRGRGGTNRGIQDWRLSRSATADE